MFNYTIMEIQIAGSTVTKKVIRLTGRTFYSIKDNFPGTMIGTNTAYLDYDTSFKLLWK